MEENDITMKESQKDLKCIKFGKLPGINEIEPNKFFGCRRGKNVESTKLVLEESEVLQEQKTGMILIPHKKGIRTDSSNYRGNTFSTTAV